MTNAVVRGWGWSGAMGELSWGFVAVIKCSDTRDWWVSGAGWQQDAREAELEGRKHRNQGCA